MELKIGIRGKQQITVTSENTAKAVGSGTLDVFATPMMVALMEKTAERSVAGYLDAGQGTVGTNLAVSHTAATPIGMQVTCESELIAVDGRKLTFRVTAYDVCGEIGAGTHERFIIDEQKFFTKTCKKLEKPLEI